jgi:hypothetical protein
MMVYVAAFITPYILTGVAKFCKNR